MMAFDLVDSRNRNRSNGSVKKYMDRNKKAIREAIKKKIADTGIKDLLDGHDVEVDVKKGGYRVSEPGIVYDNGTGIADGVVTGNTEYERGDEFTIPYGEGSGNQAGNGEDDVDSFTFRMSSNEFLDYVFDELALPDRIKKIFVEEESNIMQRAGFTTEGAPSRLSILRTYRQALGRTLAETETYRSELEDEEDEDKRKELEEKLKNVSQFRDIDLRYTYWTPAPTIKFKCVVFFIMDVSGSMEEQEKILAKGFFLLFVLFLRKCYNDVEMVFVRHTTTAEEVDEHTFFYDPKTGGTFMSPALELVNTIIKERYDTNIFNIYCAQASDGDNTFGDVPKYLTLLKDTILPQVQYYIYIEVADENSRWVSMESSSETMRGIGKMALTKTNINAAKVRSLDRLYYVFLDLFRKKRNMGDE